MNKKEKKKEEEKEKAFQKKDWKANRKRLHAEQMREEKKIMAKARKKIRSRCAGLKVDLTGILTAAADDDGNISFKGMKAKADAALIAETNRKISIYNRTNPERPMQGLPGTATRADVAEAAAGLALRGLAMDLQADIGPHIGRTAVRAYTETYMLFEHGMFDQMQPYLAETTERWAKEQESVVYKTLENSADRTGEKLRRILKDGYVRGISYENLVDESVKKIAGLEETGAYMITYTEGTRVMAEASAKAVMDKGYKKYRLSTVGDDKVCPRCEALESQTFDFKDREAGVNWPPLHPMCRCTFFVVEDKDE